MAWADSRMTPRSVNCRRRCDHVGIRQTAEKGSVLTGYYMSAIVLNLSILGLRASVWDEEIDEKSKFLIVRLLVLLGRGPAGAVVIFMSQIFSRA